MKIIQKICFVISLASVLMAVSTGLLMIWTATYEGRLPRLLLSSVVVFLGCLSVLVVIQTISRRQPEDVG